MNELKLTVGEIVVVKRRGRVTMGMVSRLGFKRSAESPWKICRRVRWSNIRSGRARAILFSGRVVWGTDIDPIYRDMPMDRNLLTNQ